MIPHWVTDLMAILGPVVLGAYAIINLITKNAISETNALIKIHIASDEQKHIAIDEHLEYTDKRVNRLEERRT